MRPSSLLFGFEKFNWNSSSEIEPCPIYESSIILRLPNLSTNLESREHVRERTLLDCRYARCQLVYMQVLVKVVQHGRVHHARAHAVDAHSMFNVVDAQVKISEASQLERIDNPGECEGRARHSDSTSLARKDKSPCKTSDLVQSSLVFESDWARK